MTYTGIRAMKIKYGSTRTVILTDNYAFKLPGFWCGYLKRYYWKQFLLGLLANMQEKEFSGMDHPKLCPVKFYIPRGFLVVMPRAIPVSEETWERMDKSFMEETNFMLPGEWKRVSFGGILVDGKFRLVYVDYGN